jgi:hypothetical protein
VHVAKTDCVADSLDADKIRVNTISHTICPRYTRPLGGEGRTYVSPPVEVVRWEFDEELSEGGEVP